MAQTFKCIVPAAGPDQDGTVYIHLRDVVHNAISAYYVAAPSVKQEMLATALAAMTSRSYVYAVLDTLEPRSQLVELLLTAVPIEQSIVEQSIEMDKEVDPDGGLSETDQQKVSK